MRDSLVIRHISAELWHLSGYAVFCEVVIVSSQYGSAIIINTILTIGSSL